MSLGAGLADPLRGLDAVHNHERLAVCTDIGSKSGNNENGKYNFIEHSPHGSLGGIHLQQAHP